MAGVMQLSQTAIDLLVKFLGENLTDDMNALVDKYGVDGAFELKKLQERLQNKTTK